MRRPNLGVRSSGRARSGRAPRFAEFFAGIGLMRMGLERAGWKIAFANDIDPVKFEMYQAQFRDAGRHYVVGDIHRLRPADIPAVELATASFPCNDLSLAGGKTGLGGKNSSAFWGFVGILRGMGAKRPPLVLVENVAGFLTSRGGTDFRDALMALGDLGYRLDAFMIDAVHFVPQSRPRLFVVGVRGENGAETAPRAETPRFCESSVRPKRLAEFMFAHPEIPWLVEPLPDPPKPSRRLEDILEDLPRTSPFWWSRQRAEYLLNQMSARHRAVADRMIAGDEWSHGTVFRRVRRGKSMAELRTDGIAGCLRTPRGGSGRQILFKAGQGDYVARLLTPRECARLMGADDFVIRAPLNRALFGFGDAVCAPVISWIGKHSLNRRLSRMRVGVQSAENETKRETQLSLVG